MRGVTRDARLLVVVRTDAWAAQVRALAPLLCERVNARMGRQLVSGLDVHVAAER